MLPTLKPVMMGLGLLALAGCQQPGFGFPVITEDTLAFSTASAEADRMVADSFRDIAFAEGRVAVVTVEDGRMRTYFLAPCQGGAAICANTADGRAVPLASNPDFRIVSGAYRGRDFYLSPGGDGVLIDSDGRHQLAWE